MQRLVLSHNTPSQEQGIVSTRSLHTYEDTPIFFETFNILKFFGRSIFLRQRLVLSHDTSSQRRNGISPKRVKKLNSYRLKLLTSFETAKANIYDVIPIRR